MLITDNTLQILYKNKKEHGKIDNKNNYKSGQRKLLAIEIDFLTKYGHLSDSVLYAGSSPGHHLDTLIPLFPNIKKWILYDPQDTKIKTSINIKKQRDILTVDIIRQKYKDKKMLFISDIRSYESNSGKHSNINEADNIIVKDMKLQKELVECGQFVMSCLKFRLPWEIDGSTTYFDGELHTTPWLGEYSPELRLFTDGLSYKEYDHKKIDSQMYWYNTTKRLTKDEQLEKLQYKQIDYDQRQEYEIIKNFLKESNEEIIYNFIKTHCMKYKPKYR